MGVRHGMGGSRQLALVFGLVLGTGCDLVFDFTADPPPEVEPYDRCGAFLYDEPLRYAAVANPSLGLDPDGNPLPIVPWSWDDARAACRLRGMDLAVFNDLHELGMAPESSVWPYWIGERITGSTSETVDGCPPVDAPSAEQLIPAGAAGCGVVAGPLEVTGARCDGQLPVGMEPAVVISALCETPRPDRPGCLGADPGAVSYVISDAPMTQANATAYCTARRGHLVVFETEAEWRYAADQTKQVWERPFWVGAKLDATTWQAVNGCAGMYSWTNGTPGTPASGSCLATRTHVANESEPGLSGTILDGVEATPCGDDQSYALCELD